MSITKIKFTRLGNTYYNLNIICLIDVDECTYK